MLDEAFAAIDTATANTEKNLANAKELFVSAVETELANPESSWLSGQLSDYVDDIKTGPFGSLLHKSDYVEGGIPLVNPINIDGVNIVQDTRKTVDDETSMRLDSYKLKIGDIVIARRGEIGRCAVVTEQESGWLCGTGCFIIRTHITLAPEFLCHMLRSRCYRERLEKKSSRATMPSISNKDLAQLQITIPPIGDQKRLMEYFELLDQQTQNILESCDQKKVQLANLKQSLLQKAFTGELTANPKVVDRTLSEASV